VTAAALDAERLTSLLREHLSPAARCVGAERGAVGNGQETWFLDVDDAGTRRQLVLRRSADGSLGWTDRAHEYEVMRALHPHGLPVPEVLWLETEPSTLERPYFVMERMPGGPLGRADSATREAVAVGIGAALARLHALPVAELGLSGTVPRDGLAAAAAELGRWRERYLSERLEPVPLLGALIAWLEANLPRANAPVVLLWGDPGPHNVLVQAGELTALLDWELSHFGHPLDDLGACLWAARAQIDAEHVLQAYERAGGGPVDRNALRWFECLACVSRSVMVIEGMRAFVEGRSSRPGLAGLGLELLVENLARAARLAAWPEPGAEPPELEPLPPALRPSGAELGSGLARFLTDDVVAAVDDRALRRGLKETAALLETIALRSPLEPALQDWRATAERRLRDELEGAGVGWTGLEEAAVEVERRDELASLRTTVRLHLLTELGLVRRLIAPLHDLYSR
jgi:aminoglycoside phosphotransferase (APT) family kinase protein